MTIKNTEYYVYFALCADGSLYIGKTNNPTRRITEHNNGKGAKFISKHGKAKLVYIEKFTDNLLACRREIQLKKWSRAKKENLIKINNDLKN